MDRYLAAKKSHLFSIILVFSPDPSVFIWQEPRLFNFIAPINPKVDPVLVGIDHFGHMYYGGIWNLAQDRSVASIDSAELQRS